MIKQVQDLLKKIKFLEDRLTPSISINTFFSLFEYIATTGIDEFIKDEDLRNVIEKASGIFKAEWSNAIGRLTSDICCALIINSDFRKVLFEFNYEDKRMLSTAVAFGSC